MRSTTKLVKSLQSNRQQLNNNAARLSQVYDEATISVDRSNTNQNNSSQTRAQLETR